MELKWIRKKNQSLSAFRHNLWTNDPFYALYIYILWSSYSVRLLLLLLLLLFRAPAENTSLLDQSPLANNHNNNSTDYIWRQLTNFTRLPNEALTVGKRNILSLLFVAVVVIRCCWYFFFWHKERQKRRYWLCVLMCEALSMCLCFSHTLGVYSHLYFVDGRNVILLLWILLFIYHCIFGHCSFAFRARFFPFFCRFLYLLRSFVIEVNATTTRNRGTHRMNERELNTCIYK